jgi:putative endopeptidase
MYKHLLTPMALAVGAALAVSGCSHRTQDQGASAPVASAPASARSAPAAAASVVILPDQPIAFTLDTQYDPCTDFANYVNAVWNQANPIPADQTRWGGSGVVHEKSLLQQKQLLQDAAQGAQTQAGRALEQKLGNLYLAGLDTAAIDRLGYDPIKPQLAQIDALKTPADIAAFIDASYNNGDGYVFSLRTDADFKDATHRIGYVDQGGLGLPTRDYYLSPQYQAVRDAYVKYIVGSLELVGTPAADAQQQAAQVLAFETDLAKASFSPTELRNLDNQYHFVTVAEADKVSPHFSWDKFFKAQSVDVGKGFSLSQPKFIAEFDRLVATAPIAQWQAYLKFHLVNNAAPYLSQAFRDKHFDFYDQTLSGQSGQKARWKLVVDAVNQAMGMGLGELYVAKYFPPQDKARAEQLVANVRDALKKRVEHLDWMSEATKQKALDKWALFLPMIGYPDPGEWRDWSGLPIVPGKWYANLAAAAKYNYHYDIGRIGKPMDRKQWLMTPQTVNAYYDPNTNTMSFPAGILQPPFFYARGDDAVNYGGIGFVIGHESSHGFDDRGSQFDGLGNRVNWWTKADREKFDARAQELVQQYDAYAPIPGKQDLHVNGKLTLSENIGDLGGLNIAYDALQATLKGDPKEAGEKIDGMTQDQRFFLSAARGWEGTTREKAAELRLNVDPHAPPAIRAFAAASNMPQFAQAFQCKPDSKMVHTGQHLVKIW